MKVKERLKIPPQDMPEQDAKERIKNVMEVPLGYTVLQAVEEAKRCLQCKKPFCVAGCPVGIDIPGFIQCIEDENFAGAIAVLKRSNLLPAVCGRVCPQEEQCQAVCTVGKSLKDQSKAVSIGRLERFAADWERQEGAFEKPEIAPATGKTIAIVGAGPAGLTVAGDMIKLGHEVTVFEALHKPGGVLVYGIPEFRLPKEIVYKEVEFLESLGVTFRYNVVIGKTIPMQELVEDFDAVFVGTGAGLPRFMNIPGENLLGVYSANEYLTRANLMRSYEFPGNSDTPIFRGKKVATIGGGNVAMDSARTALRMGAERSIIVYRRSEAEMPARDDEIHHAEQEGVEFQLLRNPLRVLGDDDSWVKGLELLRMELGPPDDSGRRRPVPVEGSNFVEEVDVVVIAIGNSPNPLIPQTCSDVKVNRWGGVVVNEKTQQTSLKGVFAGGDIVLGGARVILAMGEGRRAAKSMHEYVMSDDWDGLEALVCPEED